MVKVRHLVTWLGLLGPDSSKSRFHIYLALDILIIIPLLGHLPAFISLHFRERWAEPALSLFRR